MRPRCLSPSQQKTRMWPAAPKPTMPGFQVDGNDVLEVYEKAGEAIARARQGGGPTLLECLTYRWYGHHEGDPGVAYRAKEEIAAWRERDPVKRLKDDAIADGTLAAADFDKVDT